MHYLRVVVLGLVALSIVEQLTKPATERTWHGTLFGLIPYDYRPPTLARLRAAFWNPDDPRVLTPHAFGLGWSINLYRLKQAAAS